MHVGHAIISMLAAQLVTKCARQNLTLKHEGWNREYEETVRKEWRETLFQFDLDVLSR